VWQDASVAVFAALSKWSRRMAKTSSTASLLQEFWLFARANKVYWLVPLVLMVLAAAAVILGSATTLPYVYHLF
jgi:cell division protein FtsX